MTGQDDTIQTIREPSLMDALIPLVFMIVLLTWSIVLFGIDAAGGPLQVALLLSAVVGAVVAHKNGHSWERLAEEVVKGISLAMSAILILLMVGALIGVWNMSGTIATVVYYGIKYINPAWFYFAAALLTGLIGIVTGSSWTTAATLGVAFIGMARVIGASEAIAAGAVISGAYFGDKMTPLSETTILTPQIVGSNVYAHIRSMARASVPAYLLALLLFFLIGRSVQGSAAVDTTAALDALAEVYHISLWNLVPILVLLILGLRRFPAFLSILIGTLAGALVAVIMQPDLVTTFADDLSLSAPFAMLKGIWVAMGNGFVLESGYAEIDALFTGGGMSSMLYTVWLILGAMSFGAIMDFGGFNERLINPVIHRVKSDGSTIAATMATSVGFNIVAGDQYIALVLPSRIFRAEFAARGLAGTNLSRLAADSGTVTSPLVPWNSCGAFMSATLGVSTLLYLPYAVFCYASPALSVVFGFTGFRIEKVGPSDRDRMEEGA